MTKRRYNENNSNIERDDLMKCDKCNRDIADGSKFCPYCGTKVQEKKAEQQGPVSAVSDADRAEITSRQHYFDADFGISADNPMVVSSVAMMGCYLAAFRSPDERPFTWKRGGNTGIPCVDEYHLYLDGELYKTVYFNYCGFDTEYLPKGILMDQGALEAYIAGATPEEYERACQARRAAQEQEKLAREAEAKRQEELARRRAEEARRKAQAEKELAEKRAQERKEREQIAAQKREAERSERRKRAAEAEASRKAFWKRNKIKVIVGLTAIAAVIVVLVSVVYGGRALRYNSARTLMENRDYAAAMDAFEKMGDYKDSAYMAEKCCYLHGEQLLEAGKYEAAKSAFQEVPYFDNAEEMLLECDYRYAAQLLSQKKFTEAEQAFTLLEDYKDSKTQIQECQYQQAEELYAKKNYSAALKFYPYLQGYKESAARADDCYYQIGMEHLKYQEYSDAYYSFIHASRNYRDTSERTSECLYYIVKDMYEDKDYADAYDWLSELESRTDIPAGLDLGFVEDLRMAYVEELIASKTNSSVNYALELLESMKSSKEVTKLISKAENQLLQNQYDVAAGHLKNERYKDAVEAFAKLKDFSDGKTQWLTAMYEFVQSRKSYFTGSMSQYTSLIKKYGDKETFYKYAKTLSDNNFKDSKKYYKELTAWHAEVVMNGSADSTTAATSVSKYGNMYAHIKISGGPLDGSTSIKAVFTLPSGSKVTVKFDNKLKDGHSGWCYCYYNTPSRAPAGTCSVKIYDGNGNVIGSGKIRVVG